MEEAWVAIAFPLESAMETSPVELPFRFVNTNAWVELSEGDSAMPEAPIAQSSPPVMVNPDCTSTEPFPPWWVREPRRCPRDHEGLGLDGLQGVGDGDGTSRYRDIVEPLDAVIPGCDVDGSVLDQNVATVGVGLVVGFDAVPGGLHIDGSTRDDDGASPEVSA